ncbi:unnamed protein product [Ilex paraguariensis]|uniref:Agenet domain-containing protein n=1 Tax=Ilex paraguariensis TaxID=185542 RepID=A0ABC8TH51_9AQUA
MRYSGRPTMRPALAHNQSSFDFEVGAPVDVWWSDGWWEGFVTGFGNSGKESHQVYIPSENLSLNVDRENLRKSREWVGDQWVDIEANPDVLSALSTDISADTKFSASLTIKEAAKSDDLPMSCKEVPTNIKIDVEEDMLELPGLALSDGLLKNMNLDNNKQQLIEDGDKENDGNHVDGSNEDDNADYHLGDNNSVDDSRHNEAINNEYVDKDDNRDQLEELVTAGQKCEAELVEVGGIKCLSEVCSGGDL